MVALAYQLLNLLRRRLSNPQLHKAQVQTLREQLFKVGGLIKQTSRGFAPSPQRLWRVGDRLHLASGWPHQSLLAGALRDVCAAGRHIDLRTALKGVFIGGINYAHCIQGHRQQRQVLVAACALTIRHVSSMRLSHGE